MRQILDKIEAHRRLTDDLILKATVRMNSCGKEQRYTESDALRRSLELIGYANHHLWLASLALQ